MKWRLSSAALLAILLLSCSSAAKGISGTVADATNDRPLPDLLVEIDRCDADDTCESVATLFTDEKGRFSVTDLQPSRSLDPRVHYGSEAEPCAARLLNQPLAD